MQTAMPMGYYFLPQTLYSILKVRKTPWFNSWQCTKNYDRWNYKLWVRSKNKIIFLFDFFILEWWESRKTIFLCLLSDTILYGKQHLRNNLSLCGSCILTYVLHKWRIRKTLSRCFLSQTLDTNTFLNTWYRYLWPRLH